MVVWRVGGLLHGYGDEAEQRNGGVDFDEGECWLQ